MTLFRASIRCSCSAAFKACWIIRMPAEVMRTVRVPPSSVAGMWCVGETAPRVRSARATSHPSRGYIAPRARCASSILSNVDLASGWAGGQSHLLSFTPSNWSKASCRTESHSCAPRSCAVPASHSELLPGRTRSAAVTRATSTDGIRSII